MGRLTRDAVQRVAEAFRRGAAPRRVEEIGVVQAIERDSNGLAVSVTARIGDVDIPGIPVSGFGVRTGDALRLSRSATSLAAPDWRLEGYAASVSPFPVLDDDVSIPAPAWGSPPLATAAVTPYPGGQHATVTARIRETPERYGPQQTEIQWASDADAAAGRWAGTQIGNAGGQDAELVVVLPAAFPFGQTVNVRARTLTNSGARSPWSETRSIVTASDQTVPAAPGAFSVDTSKSLTAIITLPAPNQPLVFSHWEVSIAASSGGAGAASYRSAAGQYIHTVSSPQSIYLRIREVTRSGLTSAWNPSSAWAGPYVLAATDGWLDTTPPPAPAMASLGYATELVQGVMGVTLTAALAAYSPPADFAGFEYRYRVGSDYEFFSSTETAHKRFNVRQGVTYAVSVRAWDTSGNASAFSAELTVATPVVAAPPAPGSAPAVTPGFRGARISWAATPESPTTGRIIGYEVQRATDINNPATYQTVATVDGTAYVDAGLTPGQTYGWRYRPINAAGTPASGYSPWATAQVKAIEDGDIFAGTINANKLVAGSITADRIAGGTITGDKLAATLITAGEIRAENPGKITAGQGNVLIDDTGVTINSTGRLRFTNLSAGDYSGMRNSSNVIGDIRVVNDWRGIPGRSIVFKVQPAGEINSPGVIVEGLPTASLVSFVKLTRGRLECYDSTPALAWEYGLSGPVRRDPDTGVSGLHGWTIIDAPGPLLSFGGNANTNYDIWISGYQAPVGARAVFIRGSATIAVAGQHLYAFNPDSGTLESGAYFTCGAVNFAVPWSGMVAVTEDGRFRIRATAVFGLAVMITAYLW